MLTHAAALLRGNPKKVRWSQIFRKYIFEKIQFWHAQVNLREWIIQFWSVPFVTLETFRSLTSCSDVHVGGHSLGGSEHRNTLISTSPKCIKCFPPTLSYSTTENYRSFWIYVREKLGLEIHMPRDVIVFRKLRFQTVFRLHENKKPALIRFQIPLVWRAFRKAPG